MRFVQARWYHKGGNTNPTRIVIHDAEYPEKVTGAEDIAAYFARTDKHASAHYAVDSDSVVQCVRDEDIAYHAPPNARSIGIEHMGVAKQTTVEWLDAYGTAMLRDQSAPLVRALCDRYHINKVWLSVADVKAGRSGVTSHNNVSLAFGQSTHTDPGPDFPIDQFMAWVIQGDDDMFEEADRKVLNAIRDATAQLVAVAHRDIDTLQPLIEQVLQAVKDDPHSGAGPGDVDPTDFVAALKDALVKGTA